MAYESKTFIGRLTGVALFGVSMKAPRIVLPLIALASGAFLWTLAVAPPLLSFALTVAVGTAWCVWLEKHPDTHDRRERRGDSA